MSQTETVVEEPWCLDANDMRIAGGTASPGRIEALATGRLLAEGYLSQRSDLLSITVDRLAATTVRVRARIASAAFEAGRAEAAHRAECGCGLLHFVSCDAAAARLPRSATLPAADASTEQLRALFAACEAASPAGGVHGAALVAGDALRDPVIDVSRHAAVEKAVGEAFLAGEPVRECGLVLTARISGQIALTAARAGVAWIASRSLATSLAIAIAQAAHLPLVTRAAGRDRAIVEAARP
jgi:FdhD protein